MRAKLTSFLMILCLLMIFAAIAWAAPAGKVTNLEGRADLTEPGQPARALFIGNTVNVGDILRTKSGSKLEVTWIDGSIARLSENSRLKVTEFSMGAQKRSTILSLFRGKVQNIVTGTTKLFGTKDGSKYEVHTPTSVCGVRGTIFFAYHENGVSGVLFTQGQGFMYSKGQPDNVKPVAPGIMMIVTSANKPPEAKPAKPGDATKLFNATNPSEKKKDDKKGEDKKEGGTGGGTSGTGGGSTAASGGTGTTGTAAGMTGTTDPTTLGGDPTATLGTVPPGTSGTPISNPITPVAQVVVPVVPPTPTPTETFTTFKQQVKSEGVLDGTLTGSINNTTNTGTIGLTGTGPASIFVLPTTGTLSDGSTDNAYLAGIPGSWRGLFIGLSRKGTAVSILKGDLSGAYTGQDLSASGSVARAAGYSVNPESQYQSFTDLPLLVLQNVSTFSDPVIYGPSSGDITTDGIIGYNTSTRGILGIWGAKTLNGTYINASGDKTKNVPLYHYSYYPGYADPTDHFAFGNVTATDDLAGHTTVSGADSLTYLDRQYLGKLSLDYRGVYYLPQGSQLENGVSYAYDSVGTGIYKLEPLSWSGDWGQNQGWWYYGPRSLYQNTYYPEDGYSSMEFVAHDMGLAGGVAPFWTGTSRLTALGYLTDYSGTPISGKTVSGPLLWNSGIGARALTGTTVDDIFIPDAEFTGVTAGIWKDGLMNGSAYAIYKTAAGQAGWLKGTNTLIGSYNSDLGVWKAEGDLTPTQRIAQLPAGVTADDLEVFHDIGIGFLGGSFTGNQGIINNYSNIIQTTFYGKGLYNEDGDLEKIIPSRWGIYDLRMAYGNSFSGKPSGAASWTSKIGGYGPTQMQAPFFYLADIAGTWKADGTIDGQLSGTYMTPLYLGVLSGPFYGLYTEETTGSGGWIGQSVGTYNVTQKLAHSATWGENLYVWYSGEGGLFTDAGGWLDHTGYVMGLLGGTTAPWSGSSAFKAMGLFQLPVEFGLERGTYLWSGAIQGSVPQEIAEPASVGGIYTGYSAALWRTDSYAGAIRTLYLTPPDETTGKSTAGFLAGDNMAGTIYNLVQFTDEYNEFGTYTIGLWESTGTNNLMASAPLASGLDPAAVTLAGGSMNAKLSGTFGGAGALTNDTAWGDFTFFMNGAKPLPFGVYDLKLGSGDPGGTFSGKPTGATSWDAKLGGDLNIGGGPALAVYGGYNYEYGYWLADVGGQWNAAGEITGNVTNGKYLTTTHSGTLSGPFYGLYTEGETAGAGTWVGQSIGNYQGAPLAYSAKVLSGSWGYYNTTPGSQGFIIDDSSFIAGLMGGVSPLFGDTSADVNGMGIYSRNVNSSLFKMLLTKADGGPETNPFHLYYGGAAHPASGDYGEWFEGRMMGLYAKWNGTKYTEFGLLSSDKLIVDGEDSGYSVDGHLYPGIGMWSMVDYEYQGRLASTKMSNAETASFTVQESGWSPPATIAGDLQGTMQMQTARVLEVDDTWGIWMSAMGGSYTDSIPAEWTSRTGWKETNAYGKPSYSLATVAGYYFDEDGGLWGGISGRSLNPDNMAIFTGDMVGIAGNGNWQAMGIGSFEVSKKLAFSSGISGYVYQTSPGKLHIDSYLMPSAYGYSVVENGVEFETVYFRANSDVDGQYVKYGWQREKVRSSNNDPGKSLTYYPNDSMQMFTISHGVPLEALGKTSDLTGRPDFYASPSTSQIVMSRGYNILANDFPFSGPLSVDPASKQFAKVFSQTVEDFYAVTRVIPDINDPLAKTFQGIMGGYFKDDDPDKSGRTLWNATTYPMGLALMGEHAGFEGSASMTSGIESSYNGSGTTPDGGAYYGFLTHNVNTDRTVRGMFYGLYISPAGNAGFLQSTNIEGDSYAGLEMWEAGGDITSREVFSGIGVAPANLLAKDGSGNYANLMFGAMSGNVEYGGTSGDFVSGGSIRKLAMDSGYTVSIKGYPCNGIFITGGSGGTYANPLGAATWQADSAGYATFGYPGNFADYGIWRLNVVNTGSSWAENKIYAPVTGEFLSYAKQGTLTGTFIGGYSGTSSGIWGGNTSGVYERTRYVDFSSGMTGQIFLNGLVKWISGSAGSQDNFTSYYIFGDPDNFPADKMYVHKTANNNGTFTETRYGYQGYTDEANPIVYSKTTWQYNVGAGGSIANLKLLESKNISNDDYLAEVGTMRSGVTGEYTGYRMDDDKFQGVFAGFGNLWNNMAGKQPTEIALAGLYDVWSGKTPGIFTAGIASFDPAVSMDPRINSTSQIGGAYVAMLGGAFGAKTVPYDTLGGLLSGIYYKDGNVGILSGTWSGSNWTDIGYLKGSGAIDGGYPLGTGINEGDFALTSANFASKIITFPNQFSFDEGTVTVLKGDQVIPRSVEVINSHIDTRYLSTVGFWGIEQKAAAGTKAQGLDPKAWAWQIPIPNGTEYKGVEIISASNGISTGGYVGATQQAEAGLTLVKAGSIKGLFDPNATTWQAVSQGTFMETNTFVTKVASMDEAGKAAFMNATKIPAILAGSATLRQGPNPVNNLSNVTMNNVGFYAYSTGVAPKIWATNDVRGNYSAPPLLNNTPVPLSGNGLNANFTVNQWNGSTWGANVAGSGTLSGGSYTGPVQFAGGAAGRIDQPGAGQFSGTGAGIAK